MDTVGQRDRFPSAFVEENTLTWEEQGWPVVGGTWDQHMLTSGLGMRTVLFATGLLIAFFSNSGPQNVRFFGPSSNAHQGHAMIGLLGTCGHASLNEGRAFINAGRNARLCTLTFECCEWPFRMLFARNLMWIGGLNFTPFTDQ